MVDALNVKDRTILMATKMSRLSHLKKQVFIMLCIGAISTQCFADRIKDFADIAGQRSNQLVGYGLVVGLDGTGDQTTQTPFTLQSVLQMIGVLGVTIPQGGGQTQLRNTAAVMVTADFPALARQVSKLM